MKLNQMAVGVCAFCLFTVADLNGSYANAQFYFRIKAGGFGVDALPSWPILYSPRSESE